MLSPNYILGLESKTATKSRPFKAFRFAFVLKLLKKHQSIFDSFST